MKKKQGSQLVYDAAVVGAGASGLLAAITAARRGRRVIVFDGNESVGRKLLSTGNGRCNFLNQVQDQSAFRTHHPKRLRRVIEQFPPERILSFFEEIGIDHTERDGYYYPYTHAAKDVRDCLWMETRRLSSIEVCTTQTVRHIMFRRDHFEITAEFEEGSSVVLADKCIVAAGGMAFPKSGSKGFGYEIAEQFHHRIYALSPALCELHCEGSFFKKLKGIRLAASVDLYVDGQRQAGDIGEVQLTERGISGIPVFNVSRFATQAFLTNMNRESTERKCVEAKINFMPRHDAIEAKNRLTARFFDHGRGKTAAEALRGLIPPALGQVLLERARIRKTEKASALGDALLLRLLEELTDFHVRVIGAGDYDKAQTTAGGVSLAEIDAATMESEFQKGLYFCGEVLDVDGICGGYNLQWAWASGYVCGMAV